MSSIVASDPFGDGAIPSQPVTPYKSPTPDSSSRSRHRQCNPDTHAIKHLKQVSVVNLLQLES
jgi:hypothetical protein